MARKKRSMRDATEQLLHEFAEEAGLPGLLDGSDSGVVDIPVEDIKPNPHQPRQTWDGARIRELAASIAEQGVLQPILVRPYRGKYQIVAGERRWRAAKEAGLTHIPAIIREWNERGALLASLIENIQREDLNQVDRGQAFRKLKEVLGDVSWEDVGKKVGLTKRRILQLISLSELPERMQEAIKTGEITEKHGRALNLLSDEPDWQKDLFDHMRAAELTGEQALYAARLLSDGYCESAKEAVEQAKEKVSRPAFGRRAIPPISTARRIEEELEKLDRMTASHYLDEKERQTITRCMERFRELADKIAARMRDEEERERRRLEAAERAARTS